MSNFVVHTGPLELENLSSLRFHQMILLNLNQLTTKRTAYGNSIGVGRRDSFCWLQVSRGTVRRILPTVTKSAGDERHEWRKEFEYRQVQRVTLWLEFVAGVVPRPNRAPTASNDPWSKYSLLETKYKRLLKRAAQARKMPAATISNATSDLLTFFGILRNVKPYKFVAGSFPEEIRHQLRTGLTFAEGAEKFGNVTACKKSGEGLRSPPRTQLETIPRSKFLHSRNTYQSC